MTPSMIDIGDSPDVHETPATRGIDKATQTEDRFDPSLDLELAEKKRARKRKSTDDLASDPNSDVVRMDGIEFKRVDQLPSPKRKRLNDEDIKPIEEVTFDEINNYNRNQLRAYCSVYGVKRQRKGEMESALAKYAQMFHPNDTNYDLSKFQPTVCTPIARKANPANPPRNPSYGLDPSGYEHQMILGNPVEHQQLGSGQQLSHEIPHQIGSTSEHSLPTMQVGDTQIAVEANHRGGEHSMPVEGQHLNAGEGQISNEAHPLSQNPELQPDHQMGQDHQISPQSMNEHQMNHDRPMNADHEGSPDHQLNSNQQLTTEQHMNPVQQMKMEQQDVQLSHEQQINPGHGINPETPMNTHQPLNSDQGLDSDHLRTDQHIGNPPNLRPEQHLSAAAHIQSNEQLGHEQHGQQTILEHLRPQESHQFGPGAPPVEMAHGATGVNEIHPDQAPVLAHFAPHEEGGGHGHGHEESAVPQDEFRPVDPQHFDEQDHVQHQEDHQAEGHIPPHDHPEQEQQPHEERHNEQPPDPHSENHEREHPQQEQQEHENDQQHHEDQQHEHDVDEHDGHQHHKRQHPNHDQHQSHRQHDSARNQSSNVDSPHHNAQQYHPEEVQPDGILGTD